MLPPKAAPRLGLETSLTSKGLRQMNDADYDTAMV